MCIHADGPARLNGFSLRSGGSVSRYERSVMTTQRKRTNTTKYTTEGEPKGCPGLSSGIQCIRNPKSRTKKSTTIKTANIPSPMMRSGFEFFCVAGALMRVEVIAPGSWSGLPQVAQSHAAG